MQEFLFTAARIDPMGFEKKHLADGTVEYRRYEHDVLVEITRTSVLPSGKQVRLILDAAENLLSESHSYGLLQFALERKFKDGVKESETYFRKRRLITRSAYEKARAAFPDMPAADPLLVDMAHELALAARAESRKKMPKRAANPAAAAKLDAFCLELLRGPGVEDAFHWLEHGLYTLGELNPAASRRLLGFLRESGCPGVHACRVLRDHAGLKNSSDLVITLPSDSQARAKVFKRAGRLAREQGFAPYADDGQKFLYAKLS